MSKKIIPSPAETLQSLQESGKQFLVCSRSNGYIVPSTVTVTSFEESLKLLRVSAWPRWRGGETFSVRGGLYEVLPTGGVRNVHHELRRCWRGGLFTVVDNRLKTVK